MKPEPCANCRNVDWLYWRRNMLVCLNCATLNPRWSRVSGYRSPEQHENYLQPINQPNALGESTPKPQPCVHCGLRTYSRYRSKRAGAPGEKVVFACSWGCAGYWMDRKTEEAKLVEGEKYVRKSLGVE